MYEGVKLCAGPEGAITMREAIVMSAVRNIAVAPFVAVFITLTFADTVNVREFSCGRAQ